jgi:hypothetical protein
MVIVSLLRSCECSRRTREFAYALRFRVRVAVDGRRELSLKRAREQHADLRISACLLAAHARACAWHCRAREAFDPDRLLTMLSRRKRRDESVRIDSPDIQRKSAVVAGNVK